MNKEKYFHYGDAYPDQMLPDKPKIEDLLTVIKNLAKQYPGADVKFIPQGYDGGYELAIRYCKGLNLRAIESDIIKVTSQIDKICFALDKTYRPGSEKYDALVIKRDKLLKELNELVEIRDESKNQTK